MRDKLYNMQRLQSMWSYYMLPQESAVFVRPTIFLSPHVIHLHLQLSSIISIVYEVKKTEY